jgi:hypothetical protein
MPPGYVLFRHGHPCKRFEVVVQGTLEIFSALEGMFRLVYEDADGSIREADIRNSEMPPDYAPLPTDGDARLEPE